jgi:hypothetical protein
VELSTDAGGTIRVVYLHLNGHEAKPEFLGELPVGVGPDSTQQDVRGKLGVPQFQQPSRELPLLGWYGPSDRYDFETYSVHLQYAPTTRKLLLVTVMSRSEVPGAEDVH